MTTARDFARGGNPNYVDIDEMIRWEQGELSDEELVSMLQRLINSGMAWTLQGCYGRAAQRAIDAGVCVRP